MSLPHRATLGDIEAICSYLLSKPTGATPSEAKAVLDPRVLDPRKLAALKFWGLIDDSTGKMRLTDRGRGVAKDRGARKALALREAISEVPAYMAIIERAVHRKELTVSATDVAAHWHQHFRSHASDSDEILNQQAISFFQIAEGADLGRLIIGRKGQPTRFEFDEGNTLAFVNNSSVSTENTLQVEEDTDEGSLPEISRPSVSNAPSTDRTTGVTRVFITHGKNKKILQQVKELVAFGKFEPVVAQERETPAKPVPEKVMDDMRTCQAAVIHVGCEGTLYDKDGKEVPQINGNVLIEIGAAMALYGRNFILLVEDGVTLPSNLQGLYECRYHGDELNMEATMKILKAFNEFKF